MESERKDLRKYKRVKEPRGEKEEWPENEFRVSRTTVIGSVISQILDVLKGRNGKEKQTSVIIKARGDVIDRAVRIAEVVKRRVKGLHQISKIESTQVVEKYEPKNEADGLEKIEVKRNIPGLHICLSTDTLDTSHEGYQPPLPDDQVTEEEERRERPSGRAPRGGRGGRGGSARGGGGARGGGRGTRGERPSSSRRDEYYDEDRYEPRRRGGKGSRRGYDDEEYYGKGGGRRYQREYGYDENSRPRRRSPGGYNGPSSYSRPPRYEDEYRRTPPRYSEYGRPRRYESDRRSPPRSRYYDDRDSYRVPVGIRKGGKREQPTFAQKSQPH
eukprot:Sspe_Gene.36002::Locus_17433_Transcript_1_1_Confidence_1.000_Length_1667::g.36002::m.36002